MSRHRLLIVAVLLSWCVSARAQTDRDLAARRDLIMEANQLSAQGNHADALDRAKRAAAIRMTPSLRLFIAQEQLALGRLAEAYGNGGQCAAEAQGDVALKERDRLIGLCTALQGSLAKRVGRITVTLPTPTPANARVTVAGEEMASALIGAPYVVTPGDVIVAVTATGYMPYTNEVHVAEGGSVPVDVQLQSALPIPCPPGQERTGDACTPSVPAPPAPVAPTPAHVSEGRLSVEAGPQDSIAVDGASVGIGTWTGTLPSGPHALRITGAGMVPYRADVLLQDGQSRDVSVTLDREPRKALFPMWVWVTAGVVVAGGAGAGGYFLFKQPSPKYEGPLGNVLPGLVQANAPLHF